MDRKLGRVIFVAFAAYSGVSFAADAPIAAAINATPPMEMVATFWTDIDDQPLIKGIVKNNTSSVLATVDFECALQMPDRVKPLFSGAVKFDLEAVLQPGQSEKFGPLEVNMFSDLGQAIAHQNVMPASQWVCTPKLAETAGGDVLLFDTTAVE